MFNFKELSKLFKYNYKNFFINMRPHENKRIITDSTFYNALSGSILLIIGYLLAVIVLAWAVPLVDTSTVNYFGISFSSVIGNSLLIIYSLGIIVYSIKNHSKEQTGMPYFVILLISLVLMIILLFRIITFFGVLNLSTVLGILGFISVIICFLGYGFLSVGIIDYLIILKRDYLNLTTTLKK